jgi:hypothetical protein
MPPSLRELLIEPGLGDYPEFLRPYVTPLTRSIAAPPGSKLLPSRSGAVGRSTEHFGTEANMTEWTPYKFCSTVEPVLSSGPQAGEKTRPAQAEAYQQNEGLWKLSGVAEGWSRPYAPTPGRQPTTKLAIGNWTPFGGASAPLPSNPTPAQMVRPGL